MRAISALLLSILLLLTGISVAAAAKVTVSGSLLYRERLLLPAGASIDVRLVDLAQPDRPIAQAQTTTGSGARPPIGFTLNVEQSLFRAGAAYGLVAEIASADGAYWFRSETPVPVAPAALDTPVEILLAFAGRKPDPEASFAKLYDSDFQVKELTGATLDAGHLPTFRVSSDLRVSGRSGCNNWFSQADLDGHNLTLSPVAATRMACLDPTLSAQETAFFAALGKVRSWRFDAVELVLADESGKELMTLQRFAFN